jgi:hypothetical protein
MDKHILAKNPMRSPQGGLCIVRTVQPVSIYEVLEGSQTKPRLSKTYHYVKIGGQPMSFTLRCHHFFSTDIDTPDETQVYKFMDDAWYWFKAYLDWKEVTDSLANKEIDRQQISKIAPSANVKIIDWLKDHPLIKIHGLEAKIGMPENTLRGALNYRRAIPLKYLTALKEELTNYGYKD